VTNALHTLYTPMYHYDCFYICKDLTEGEINQSINHQSKVFNDLNTAKRLIDMQVLCVCHFIKRDATYTITIIHCLHSMLECTKHIGNDYCPKTNSAVRLVWKVEEIVTGERYKV
jgi:hypothetical protein